MAIKLAVNYINYSPYLGHMQIVNTANNTEIEVQSWLNPETGTPNNSPWFQYIPIRQHNLSSNTPYAPDTAEYDPQKYGSVVLNTGDRDAEEVWNVLSAINELFIDAAPTFLYDQAQNSNSYAATLLWMVGIDAGSYLSYAKPSSVWYCPGVNENILLGEGN